MSDPRRIGDRIARATRFAFDAVVIRLSRIQLPDVVGVREATFRTLRLDDVVSFVLHNLSLLSEMVGSTLRVRQAGLFFKAIAKEAA